MTFTGSDPGVGGSATTSSSAVGAMVLSAGYGTRLGELGREHCKALWPLCNVPLGRWALALLAHSGLREVTLNLHHRGAELRDALGDGERWGMKLSYSVESELLGTGGGIKAMAALGPPKTQVIVNAKIAADVDLGEVLAFHRQQRAIATMVLVPHRAAEAWGAIGVDETARVVRILDRQLPGRQAHANHLFTGIHVVEPELIEAIPASAPSCIIRAAYLSLLERGAPIYGFVHQGYFYEHSTPERYLAGNVNLVRGDRHLPAAPGPLSGVDPRAEIHPSARLVGQVLVGAARIGSGARVGPGVVLGDDVEVADGAVLSECVVWPGTRITHAYRRAIVSPRRSLVVPPSVDPMATPR